MTEKELTKGAKRILDETEESANGMSWHQIHFGKKIFDLCTPPGMPWLMANESVVTVTEWGVDPSKIFGGYASSFLEGSEGT